MKTATIRQAQHHLSELLDQLKDGEEIVITRRGQEVAKLSPIKSRKNKPFSVPDFASIRREIGTEKAGGPNSILQERYESV